MTVEKKSKKCSVCGLQVEDDENVCRRCGNVFRKDVGEWDWKLVTGGRNFGKIEPKNGADEQSGQD